MVMQKRHRGVVLKYEGLQKLKNARFASEVKNNNGISYTFEQLSELTQLDLCTVKKAFSCKQKVDIRTLQRLFIAFNIELSEDYYSTSIINKHVDLKEAISTENFYGRADELASLKKWIFGDCCRLVAIVGMGGIGKTALSVKFAEQIQHQFEYVIWQSLKEAPLVQDMVANFIQSISGVQETKVILAENLRDGILQLLYYLRNHRCLLILDGMESILSSCSRAGIYREGYEGYGDFLKLVAEASHKSCLIFTSREKPKEVALLEGKTLPVRSLRLNGLNKVEGQEIFKAKGLSVADSEGAKIIELYAGNPFELKAISTTIQNTFMGNINEFLQQNTTVSGDIRDILEQQFNRLSDLEMNIIYWLAINREPIGILELQKDIIPPIPQAQLLEALESLERRSLVEISRDENLFSLYTLDISKPTTMLPCNSKFTLQPVLMEYVTEKLVAEVCSEISLGKPRLSKSHALMKASMKDCVTEAQVSFILIPVLHSLLIEFGNTRDIEEHFNQTLAKLRETSPLEPGYAAGNIINLLCQLRTNLSGYDFSYLAVWQACFKYVHLQEANFAYANLEKCVFAENFGCFSSNNQTLAISGEDKTIRLWDRTVGELLNIVKAEKPYERMNIRGVTGLSKVTIAQLKELGAVD